MAGGERARGRDDLRSHEGRPSEQAPKAVTQLEGVPANFAFVGPQPEYAPAPFRRHRACTIC